MPGELMLLSALDPRRFDTSAIHRATIDAARRLAELKGVVATIPNQAILLNTLALQEAKDSSAVESIVTTHDELFRSAAFPEEEKLAAAKEVQHYAKALGVGHEIVIGTGLLTGNGILGIQATLEQNKAGYRKLPGTELKDDAGRTVYIPPDPDRIHDLMSDLERFINLDEAFDADPLVRMAIIHHQFESIHPFYDGNGRTGRIINVLYLVLRQLLDIPVLYLSRHIVRTKNEYYRLLQAVRTEDAWEEWVVYMLEGVTATAAETIGTIRGIADLMLKLKHRIRSKHRFYSQDLVNSLFRHPYTRITFVMEDLRVSRLTATRYLDLLADDGILLKLKQGRASYYVNVALVDLLTGVEQTKTG